MARFSLYWGYVALISCLCLKCGGQRADGRHEQGVNDSHYKIQAVVAAEMESGIDIAWTSSTEIKSGQPPNHLALPNQYFGQECGTDRCNLVIVDAYTFLSVANGVLVMRFDTSNETFQDNPTYHIFGQPEIRRRSCQPTTIFIPRVDFQYVACVNVTAQIFYFLKFDLSLVNLSESSLDRRLIASNSLSDASLTNFIYDADAQCFIADSDDYIFFADSHTVKVYSTKNRYVVDEQRITEQCSHAESLEYYGEDTVLVRCPDNVAERLEVCIQNTIRLFTPNVTGIPYPCGTWDKVAYLKSSGILIESQDPSVWIDFNLTSVEHAECVSANQREYIVLWHEDRVVVVETGNKIIFHTLTNVRCINSSHCFRPQIWEKRFIGYTNGSHFLVKDLYCLLNSEIIILDSNPRVADLLILDAPLTVECGSLQATTVISLQPTTLISLQPSSVVSLQSSTVMSFQHTVIDTVTQTPTAKPPIVVPQDVNQPEPTASTSMPLPVIIIIVVVVIAFVVVVVIGIGVIIGLSIRNRRLNQQDISISTSPTGSAQTLSMELQASLQGDTSNGVPQDMPDALPKTETPWDTGHAGAKDELTGHRTRHYSIRNENGGAHPSVDQFYHDSDLSTSSAASHEGCPSHLDNEQPRLKPLSAENTSQPIEQDPNRPNFPYDASTVAGTSLPIPYWNIDPRTVNEAYSVDQQNDTAYKASRLT